MHSRLLVLTAYHLKFTLDPTNHQVPLYLVGSYEFDLGFVWIALFELI